MFCEQKGSLASSSSYLQPMWKLVCRQKSSCEWEELLMMTFLYYIRVVNWKELYHPIYTTYNVRCMFCMYCHCHTINRSREGVARHNDSRQCENVCGIHLRQNICAGRCFEKSNICLFSVLSAETSLLYLFVSLK